MRLVLIWTMLALPAYVAAQCELAKPVASDPGVQDFFGFSVAIAGDAAVAGASRDDDGGLDAGAVYVFRRVGDAWRQEAKLTASDASDHAGFGHAAFDGQSILVGASGDSTVVDEAGAAYVFVQAGSSWTEEAKLTASDADDSDRFGNAVSIDGDFAVVGAHLDDEAGATAGAAYVFERRGGAWTQVQKLIPSDAAPVDVFGESVSISGDTIAVGAIGDDELGSESGAAYVFRRVGGRWVEEAKVLASNGDMLDHLGHSIDLDGDTLIVGAPVYDGGTGTQRGAAYVFTRSGTVWSQAAFLTASDGVDSDMFGWSVAVRGSSVLVGSTLADAPYRDSGAAYLFEKVGAEWIESAKLFPHDPALGDELGHGIDVDDAHMIVGSFRDDDGGADSGSAYIFRRTQFATYGAGLAGTGGAIPKIAAAGCTTVGRTLVLDVSDGLGGACGCLAIGSAPAAIAAFGGTLLVDPAIIVTHELDGPLGAAGAGTFSVTLDLLNPGLAGMTVYAQAGYLDRGAAAGVSFTQGLSARIE